jgi:hypothetical protein
VDRLVDSNLLLVQINVENTQYNANRNMNKKPIRLTESDLHRIVKESVKHKGVTNNHSFYCT